MAVVAELSPRARCLLVLLGRFGFLTSRQARAWLACAATSGHRARMELEARGWVSRLTVTNGSRVGQQVVNLLTARGRLAFRRLAERPVVNRGATLRRLDEALAAVDLALELQAEGAGTWQTWSEYGAAHTAQGRLVRPPAGVLVGPDGTCAPVWVLLELSAPTQVRTAVRTLHRRWEFLPGRIYAPPGLCRPLEDLGTHARVTPWTPPHLSGRPPLGPGWCTGAGCAASPAGPEVPRRPFIGPRMLSILTFLDRFGHATSDQAARQAGISGRGAQRCLVALERCNLARRRREGPAARRGEAWSASAAGLRTIGCARSAVGRRPIHRRHSLALVDLALHLEASGTGRWETERELASQMGPQSGLDRITPPDGRLTLPDGRRILIQLQLSRGNPSAACRNAWRQCHRGLGDAVRFVCLPEVAPVYRRAIRPVETDFLEVTEWVPPDRSGRMRELDPPQEAKLRRAHEQQGLARAGGTGRGGGAKQGV